MKPLTQLEKNQNDYIANMGGPLEMRESDDIINDGNREIIAAYKARYDSAFLGRINFDGKDRLSITRGEKSIYTPYAGQTVYNFSCDFCVPAPDAELARMIQKWNLPHTGMDNLSAGIASITDKIVSLGGIFLIWT
ncbi:MAG: hypothetical protein RSD27_11020 [Ruthenibacterium sp.]